MIWINIQLEHSVVEACVQSVKESKSNYIIECHNPQAGHRVALSISEGAMFQQTIHSLSIPKAALIYTSRTSKPSIEIWDFKDKKDNG